MNPRNLSAKLPRAGLVLALALAALPLAGCVYRVNIPQGNFLEQKTVDQVQVGMTRAHMADPHIVQKIVEGREEDIRPCVGATYCLDRIYQGGMALCIHNPSTGREGEQPHQIAAAAAPRRVVVVGAGPAGLEAARVAALRQALVRPRLKRSLTMS